MARSAAGARDGEFRPQLARLRVPDPDGAVLAARRDLPAAGTELDRLDRAGVAGQQGQLKLAGDVPDARRSVLVSSHDLPSVRAECGVLGRRPVCGEGRYDLSGGDAVYDYAAVDISSDDLAAVED